MRAEMGVRLSAFCARHLVVAAGVAAAVLTGRVFLLHLYFYFNVVQPPGTIQWLSLSPPGVPYVYVR